MVQRGWGRNHYPYSPNNHAESVELIVKGKQLADYTILETKALLTASGDEMTRTVSFERAWRLGLSKKDFSLDDEIYHPDYKAVGSITGIEVNLATDKEAYLALIEHLILTPAKTVDEGEDFLRIERYTKYRETDIFMSGTTTITYKDGKIITLESIPAELDYDSNEGRHWK